MDSPFRNGGSGQQPRSGRILGIASLTAGLLSVAFLLVGVAVAMNGSMFDAISRVIVELVLSEILALAGMALGIGGINAARKSGGSMTPALTGVALAAIPLALAIAAFL